MGFFKGRRPSPAMIVAGTALVIALAGTAMAAPSAIKSVLSKSEKSQVKKIAKNLDGKIPIPTTLPPNGPAGGNLTGNYPNPTVAAGSLGANQVASNTGSTAITFGALAAGECDVQLITVDAGTTDDIIIATPDPTINPLAASGTVSVWTQQSTNNNQFRFNICNISNAAIADVPNFTLFWMTFDR
jgi:hypothetical protein